MRFSKVFPIAERQAWFRKAARVARAAAFAAWLPACLTIAAGAQAVPVPRTGPAPAPGTPAAGLQVFDAQHLKDRPYSGALPKPIFPSTDRVQRAFTVAYVYDYAFSSYTPAVQLPIVARSAAKRDTPESAVIAFTSAMRSGDFDAFVQCWDEADRKALQQTVKDPATGPAFWQGIWKKIFAGKPVVLLDRVEVMGYVLLDFQVEGSGQLPQPVIFKIEDKAWVATNDLGNSGSQFLANFSNDRAGIVGHVQPVPAAQLTGPTDRQIVNAQAQFLKDHTVRNLTMQAGN